MNKLLLLSFVIACCLVGSVHSSSGCTSNKTFTSSETPNTGVSKLNIAVDSSYTYQYKYYYTTGSKVEASVSVCSDAAAVDTFIALTSGSDAITLTVKPGMASTVVPQATTLPTGSPTPSVLPPSAVRPSAAGRVSFSPLAAVMSICLACVFAFPKQRFSFFVVFVVVALAFYAPVSQAEKASSTVITINIGIPSSISSVCINGDSCVGIPSFPYVVSLNSKVYSTLDQVSACTNGQAMTLPDGWTIAPFSDEANLVIVFNSWTADSILTSGSNAYKNNENSVQVAGSYTQNGKSVTVADCTQKVLITPTSSNAFPIDPTKALISVASITNFVTFGSVDYAVADNTAFGTSTRASQASAIFVQSSDAWQVAQYLTTYGAAQVAVQSQTNSFGSECVTMKYNGGYTSFNASSFATCARSNGASDIVSVSYGAGSVFGIARGGAYTTKMLLSRTSLQVGVLDSWNTRPVINETYTLGGVMYAMLDNAPVNGASATGCQNRFFSEPTNDWFFASATQLSALVADLATSGKWANTDCFTNTVNSTSRSGVAGCAGSSVQSVGLSTFYRTSSACARTVIVHALPAASFTIGLKVAIITKEDTTNLVIANAISMLDAREIPYTVFANMTSSISTLALTSGTGANTKPLYYAIVLGESLSLSVPNAALQKVIADYRFAYDVRVVALNVFPSPSQGVVMIGSVGKASSNNNVYMESAFTSAHSEHTDGVVPDSLFELPGATSFYYVVNPGYNAVPFLRATAANSSVKASNDEIVAALVTNTDGTEELQFYISINGNSYTGPCLSHVWISWMTRGLYIGWRRVYFNPQIDDLLLPTEQYLTGDPIRMSGADMKLTAEYYENVLAPTLPLGSYVTLTFGINGWGQLNVTAFNDKADAYGIVPGMKNDDLADSIVEFYESFFWESHTFSHKDFTCSTERDIEHPEVSCQSYTTADTIKNELEFNNRYFNEELFENLGGINGTRFSKSCMITPAITGLVGDTLGNIGNPSSIDAIAAAGMTCVVGDNTRPVLIAPNPYDGLFSTTAVNGGADNAIFIIPRFATEVYYNTWNTSHIERLFNDRYGPNAIAPLKPFYDHELNTNEILALEAKNNFWHLSALRHDPYMFHQCNLAHFPYTAPGESIQKQWSLVTLWTKAVVEKYLSHMTLPLISNKQNDLQDVYFARRARNACHPSATLAVNNGVMGNIVLTTTNSTCTPIITGLSDCTSANGCSVQSYGEDRTAFFTLADTKAATTTTVTFPGNTLW